MQKKQKDIDAAQVQRVIDFLKSNGAGTHVRRSDVGKVSCGMLNPGTCANDDSLQRGPDERVCFGARGCVSYPIASLVRYMVGRGFVIEIREDKAA